MTSVSAGGVPTEIRVQHLDFLTISMAVAFARCPRKFFYSYEASLRSKEVHPALIFGEAMHKAFPVAHVTGDLSQAMDAFLSVWQHTTSQDEKRNPDNAQLMLWNFIQAHQPGRALYELVVPPKSMITISDRTSPYEVPFALDFGLPFPLAGRIDAICRHRDTKELWGLEYKTTSELSDRFINSFRFNPQACCYTTALQTLLGEPIKGMILEGVLVSKTRQDSRPQLLYIQQHQLDDFATWIRWIGHQIVAMQEQGAADGMDPTSGEAWPQQYTGCNPYPMFAQPGYNCEYGDLCSIEDWRLLASIFRRERYMPFVVGGVDHQTING
jgi:hypothetical protein